MNIRRIAALTSLASLGLCAFAARDSRAETIASDGKMSLELNFQTIPTATAIADMQSYMDRAARIFCDATEGQLTISDVRFTLGASSEESADIIYQSTEGGRSFAANGTVHLYRQSTSESRHKTTGITIAHELGHTILGLGDSYREDARFGTGCGIGPGV